MARHNRKSLMLLLIASILLALNLVAGQEAVIKGDIYDSLLQPVDKAIVVINTTPTQVVVVHNASYELRAPLGEYLLIVKLPTSQGLLEVYRENISISSPGTYYYDIILTPSLDLDLLENNADVELEEPVSPYIYILLALFFLLVLFFVLFLLLKSKKISVEMQSMANNAEIAIIIDTIKRHGGRITQRDLARKLNMSKSKISLLLSELEARGLIKKYKKGRGNIIVLMDQS